MPTDDPLAQAAAQLAARCGLDPSAARDPVDRVSSARIAPASPETMSWESGSHGALPPATTVFTEASLGGGPPDPPLAGGEPAADPPVLPRAEGAATPAPAPPPPGAPLGAYADLGPLGQGGMGEVRRVWDSTLRRALALKVIHPGLASRAGARDRFYDEARATAQLQHPAIVPIHELGTLPDGRPYYTMKEVQGRTLDELIQEAHAPSGEEDGGDPARIRRLVEVFSRVCEAVGYAHSRSVIHRDLKPANVMVGDFGEVLVLDWGLAKVLVTAEEREGGGGEDPPAPDTTAQDPLLTRPGSVQGTPAYMPPEQARGESHRVGPASDVYALGCVLYQVLSGRAPYRGASAWAVLVQVNQGPPPPLAEVAAQGGAPPVPEELRRIVARAMDRDPERRHPDAGALARDVSAWLDGARRREAALELVARADALAPEVALLRQRAAALRAEAEQALEGVPLTAPLERKRPGWLLEDEAARLVREANVREVEYVQTLRAALVQVEDLPLAHDRLADHYRARLEAAEAARDEAAAAENEALLRAHGRSRHLAWLRGDGALTLVTDPPGAEVVLERYVQGDRRLVPVEDRVLGRTPLRGIALPRGSYRLRLRAEGRAEVLYPVRVGRGEHWDGVPPGEADPRPIALPSPADLDPGEVYVPAGWMIAGGDPAASGLPRCRIWVDGFVVQRFPVTNAQYIEFLDDLVAQGREEEALRAAPRERAVDGEEAPLVYGRDAAGRFVLRPDADGDLWGPDWPVVLVDHGSASAYARWLGLRRRQGWRLPGELEWEKAARGVDGRDFPWGDFLDPTWCLMRDSYVGRPTALSVENYPTDESPYGVRGMAGGVRDWCADPYAVGGPLVADGRAEIPPVGGDGLPPETRRAVRGGGWGASSASCRVTNRNGFSGRTRYPVFGFRLVRSFP